MVTDRIQYYSVVVYRYLAKVMCSRYALSSSHLKGYSLMAFSWHRTAREQENTRYQCQKNAGRSNSSIDDNKPTLNY